MVKKNILINFMKNLKKSLILKSNYTYNKKKFLKNFFLKKYKFLIPKFINLLMINGKKSISEKLFFTTFKILSLKTKKFPFFIFFFALKNISPLVNIRSIKIKGRSYQVPIPLKESKQFIIGIKWLIKTCQNIKLTKTNLFSDVLTEQLLLAYKKKGEIIKKKYELHRLAKANRLFSNFRWF